MPPYYMSNWSMMKRSVLIGSLSGPNFPIWTTKMDHSQTNFPKFLYETWNKKKHFPFMSGGQFRLKFSKSGLKNASILLNFGACISREGMH